MDDVEPTDRLTRTRQETRAHSRHRRTWWVAGGAGLVTASLVTVALTVGGSSPERATDPAAGPSATPVPESPRTAYPVFYVGPGPNGPDAPAATLYRSYVEGDSPLEVLMTAPGDPDYATRWPSGSLLSYEIEDAAIEVVVSDDAPVDDELARQQLVYTLQALEQSDLPVAMEYEFIEPLLTPITRAPALDVLSHMSIDEPGEGSTFASGESFTVTGRGNSFEASGQCSLETEGGTVIDAYLAQMDGWIEPRLYPWELEIELTDVSPGTYTVVCITDDPTGGTEGRGTDSDTRTVIVE